MLDQEEEILGVVALRIAVKPEYAARTGSIEVGPKLYYPDHGQWSETPASTRAALTPYMRESAPTWRHLEVEEPTWGAILHAVHIVMDGPRPARGAENETYGGLTMQVVNTTGMAAFHASLNDAQKTSLQGIVRRAVAYGTSLPKPKFGDGVKKK